MTTQNLIDEAQPLTLETGADGTIRFRFKTHPGLFQFSVIADAREFNWDELYTTLNDWHGINGERTGPWDFHLFEQSRPLVPSYWVTINGKKIGLWFFQRVSIEDIAAKRFRGRMAFYVPRSGETVVELQPYRPFKISWLTATLERDPEDRLDPLPDTWGKCPAAQWAEPGFWDKRRQELATTHAMYQEPLQHAFEWILKSGYAPNHVLMLMAAYRMENNAAYREKLFAVLDEAIAKPHWGNPKEDGYSHDGDMGAGASLFGLAWAWHALADELGDERRAKLKAKLALQGDRFFHLALLNRDYWGGSVMQDHGRIALPLFGVAALHLLGVLPDAPLWTQYVIPRVKRSIHAMPRDGVIPISSYCTLPSYMDHQTWFRDTVLAMCGQDLFDEGPFQAIIDYINTTLRPEDFVTVIDLSGPFIGGNAFLNRLATKYGDARAAYLQEVAVKSPRINFSHPVQQEAFYNGALWGFLSYDPRVKPVAELPTAAPLTFFTDSGLAFYRNVEKDITFTVRCGPWIGHHAYRHAQGPCDRMGMGVTPGPGHFTIARGHTHLLTTPDTGYKLRALVKSCLLVDGGGQYDDVGYPMSIPSKLDRGEEIQFAKWDDATQSGWVRLNLAPAYRDELQMAAYVRDFFIHPDRLICRDQVVLNEPHQLAWLFQGKRETGIALIDDHTCRFGKDATIDLTPRPVGFELKASVQETPVVWSYSSGSGFKPFDHVRYNATQPLNAATVEFVFKW